MAKGEQKVYMPLMIGDWLKGTRGMRADVKGIYIGLLVHQWDHGYIPADPETLALIEPEVGKVWVFLKDKFEEIAPGKLQNRKCEEVREFWGKQRKNGEKGGRPKKENPTRNPKLNPKSNPNTNLHNDLDLDNDLTTEGIDKEGVQGEKNFMLPDVPGDELIFPFNSIAFREAWARWKEYRFKEHDRDYAALHSEQAALKLLSTLGESEAVATIDLAIAGKWANLWPHGSGPPRRREAAAPKTQVSLEELKARRHGNV